MLEELDWKCNKWGEMKQNTLNKPKLAKPMFGEIGKDQKSLSFLVVFDR